VVDSHGWSLNYCIVILVFGLTSKHLFSTDMHSGLSSLATAEGILYFPDLMLSIVSWQEEPLKGSYPTSIP